MKKYQFGGDDLYSSGFFSNLLNYLGSQQENQQTYEVDEPEQDTNDNEDSEYDNSDYQDLLEKYNQLSEEYSQLQRGQLYNNKFDDGFLDFLFSDNSNLPITFPEQTYQKPATKSNKGFRTFGSYAEGRAALENQLELYKTGRTRNPVKPTSTLYEAMGVYAPASDNNNPKAYAEFIAKRLGISPNTPISQIDTKKWADAVEKMEGNKVGNNPGNLRPARQFGGVANSEEELYRGLNGSDLKEMLLNLPSQYNMIRGLDSGQPVYVQDELGKEDILVGKYDTKPMYGKVHEVKL